MTSQKHTKGSTTEIDSIGRKVFTMSEMILQCSKDSSGWNDELD